MIPFIDFHTHHIRRAEQIVQILNIFPREEVPENSFFSAGIHPWYAADVSDKEWQLLEEKLNHPACLAIGEAGLDKMKKYLSFYEEQKKVFLRQIHLADKMQKPLVIHCVRCYDDLFRYLELLEVPVIIHGYSKSPELAGRLLKIPGLYLSFGHLLLNSASHAYKSFLQIDLNRALLETDDKPILIEDIYKQAAQIKKLDIEKIKQQMADNFRQIFKKSVILP